MQEGDLMQRPVNYDPQPIDLNSIVLPDALSLLTEDIAESLHDVWARNRLNEGWTWGHERNDSLRTTPCLVPYRDLPENEKTYDRNMVTSTIKILLARGYKIEKTTGPVGEM